MKNYILYYKHNDMNPDYTGSKSLWAKDEKTAMKLLTGKVTKMGQWVSNKRGAAIKVTNIEEL